MFDIDFSCVYQEMSNHEVSHIMLIQFMFHYSQEMIHEMSSQKTVFIYFKIRWHFIWNICLAHEMSSKTTVYFLLFTLNVTLKSQVSFFYFSAKIRRYVSCEWQTIHKKCQVTCNIRWMVTWTFKSDGSQFHAASWSINIHEFMQQYHGILTPVNCYSMGLSSNCRNRKHSTGVYIEWLVAAWVLSSKAFNRNIRWIARGSTRYIMSHFLPVLTKPVQYIPLISALTL